MTRSRRFVGASAVVLLVGQVLLLAPPVALAAPATPTDANVTHHDDTFNNIAPAAQQNSPLPGVTYTAGSQLPDCTSFGVGLTSQQWKVIGPDTATTLEGQVTGSKLSTDDNPLDHHSRDRNFFVYPDLAYQHLLASPGNFQQGEQNEHGRMEVEWESAALPAWALPMQGDWVHVEGSYIVDCAHGEHGFRTEMHPPRLLMTLRDAASATWSNGVVSIPPRPGWADTMPGLGSVPVQTTRADIYASSDGGEARGEEVGASPDWYQPTNEKNYDLFVPAPPRPAGNATMIYTRTDRPLPTCSSDDDCPTGAELFYPGDDRITTTPQDNPPGVRVHINFSGYNPPSTPLYALGLTVRVAWDKPAITPPRRVRVVLDSIYVANPMDGSPPSGCISLDEFCDGQFAISALVGDTFKHLRLCCGSSDTSDNTHQDVPYSEDVNNYLYRVDGTSALCGLASAGNPDGSQCQNTFEVTLLDGQPLKIFLRGDEHEALDTNQEVGLVDHIFTAANNYGVGGGPNHDGYYTEWFQERSSAGGDDINGSCSPPNGPCVNINYHIQDDPIPAPPSASVSAVGSPTVTALGATWVTSASTITLAGQAPAGRSGDNIELHSRYWRTGTTPPADAVCASGTGTATCNLKLTSNDGGDGTYTIEFFAVDTTTGALGATLSPSFNLDNTPPTTTASLGGTLVRGWYNTPVNVTLSANDGAGVGVDHTTYELDGGIATTYTAPFTVTAESASHSVAFASVDQLQNAEPGKSVAFKIDTTPPTLSITSASDGTFTYAQDDLVGGMFTNAATLTVNYSASDALSGLYQVRLDGQTLTTASGTFHITLAPGISNHDLVAEDVAGNLTTLSFPVVSIPPGTFTGGVLPQGYGFWKNAAANHVYSNAQMDTFLAESDIASHIFGRPVNRYPDVTLATYQTILQFPPSSSTNQKVERALLVAWLDFMSGREPAAQPINVSKISGWQTVLTNTGGSPNTTALNLVRETERRLAGTPSGTVLSTIQALLENLTEGKLNS